MLKKEVKVEKPASNYTEKIYNAKRKSAICRLKIATSGHGIKINGKDFDKYFYESKYSFQTPIIELLDLFNLSKSFAFSCRINGGGKSAQASSILYALARALRAKINQEFAEDEANRKKLLSILRNSGYLTLDRRKVEPKKYGHRKSRAKEQFVRR